MKREHEIGELTLFHPCNKLLEAVLGKFLGIFFKNSLRGLGGRRVKQDDRHPILSESLRDTGELLVSTQTLMPAWRAEKPNLISLPFHVFLDGAVIKYYESVGAFKTHTYYFQSKFNLVLLADDDLQPRASLGKYGPMSCRCARRNETCQRRGHRAFSRGGHCIYCGKCFSYLKIQIRVYNGGPLLLKSSYCGDLPTDDDFLILEPSHHLFGFEGWED